MRPVPISYVNNSGEAIPRFAIVELAGDCATIADSTGTQPIIKVRKPTGTGPYALDYGKGTGASGATSYGQLIIATPYVGWVKYSGTVPAAWSEVGPVSGQWYVTSAGTGFYYAGAVDSTNGWMLVLQKGGSGDDCPIVGFEITVPDCDNGVAQATVISRSCCAGSPDLGDTIQVCDTLGCMLIGSNAVLTGRKGFAQRQCGIACGTGTGTGTGDGAWAIISLCFADVTCV